MDPAQTASGGVIQEGEGILDLAMNVWSSGGWVMIPLFLLALYIYYEATAIVLHLGRTGIKKCKRETWQRWLEKPGEGTGYIGEAIRFITHCGYHTEEILSRVEQVKASFVPPINQRIAVLSGLVTIAPLMGLLGTVIGMLTTFKGLAQSSGQTVDLVAQGISEALITTQTGLMIAIPGYVFISLVIKRRNDYLAWLAQVENYAVQLSVRYRDRSGTDAA